ncbi:MAG TPA: hypothetical protein VMH20_16375 [Verrucomicrobiae bacterium]|nr:hypothetical protein [Verrucomicrobiae bacterium]
MAARCSQSPQTSSASQNEAGGPYSDQPLKKLVKEIPELKGIRPANDEAELANILQNAGAYVDQFFNDAVDLVADEEIIQERSGSYGSAFVGRPVRDSYLILRDENGDHRDFDEFRMDKHGNRMDQLQEHPGFLVTSGFALICMHFSTTVQPESIFRYLGEQKLGDRDAFVVAFAQRPDKATTAEMMVGPEGTSENLLTQGIAWIDKENFRILRMRTDLLRPHPEVGLDQQTTKVNFSEVRLADIATPLWLPKDVDVYLKLGKSQQRLVPIAYRNIHHYSDYRRYRVAVKMLPPQ